jgi:hypothetical protein
MNSNRVPQFPHFLKLAGVSSKLRKKTFFFLKYLNLEMGDCHFGLNFPQDEPEIYVRDFSQEAKGSDWRMIHHMGLHHGQLAASLNETVVKHRK